MSSAPSDPSESQSPEPSVTAGSETTTPPGGGQPAPRDIDEYRLIETIGEGGMGVIYKAEQRGVIRRIVALKVIKLGLDTKAVIARFEAERQALALMNHPNIARVFGAGSTPLGRPYFVMEYVPGDPITLYCDKHKLSIRQRLELFSQVCDAIQHAHTKGIIHRDLKATNVLVAEIDGKPVPKVIDFGVAKATNQRLTEQTLFTQAGQLIGTPAYMSPEQAEGGDDVDTRTDVYALGVLLYELLTGALPFDPLRLRSAAFRELQRIIREDEPPRPSTFYSTATEASRIAAQRRAATVEELARTLRSELEWIPLHAMRKEPGERYVTAAEFAKDIENYLTGKPLIAAPDSRMYRLRKTLRRNRGPVAAAAAVVLALLLGIVLTSWQAWRAVKAERLAERNLALAEDRYERANVSAGILNEFFNNLTPEQAKSRDTTLLRELVDEIEHALVELLPNGADRSGHTHLLGDVYRKLGDMAKARNLLELGVALEREAMAAEIEREGALVAGHRAQSFATALDRLARWHNDMDQPLAMVPLYEEAVSTLAAHCGDGERQRTIMMANLAVALNRADRAEEGRAAMQAVWERAKRYPDHLRPWNLASLLRNDGEFSRQRGDLKAAAERFEKADALYRQKNERGEDAVDGEPYALLMYHRANLAADLGRLEEAHELIERCIDIKLRLYGSLDHLSFADALEFKSVLLERRADFIEAADAALAALNIRDSQMPADHHTLTLLVQTGERVVRVLQMAARDAEAADVQARIDHWRAKAVALASEKTAR